MATHKEKAPPPPRNQATLLQPRTSASGLVRNLRNRPRSEKDKAPTRSKYFELSEEGEPTRNYFAQHEDTGLGKIEDVMHVEDESDKDEASMGSKTRRSKRKPGIALQRADKQGKKARPTIGQIPGGSPTEGSPTGGSPTGDESGNEYRDNMIHLNTMAFLKGKKFSKSNRITWGHATYAYIKTLELGKHNNRPWFAGENSRVPDIITH